MILKIPFAQMPTIALIVLTVPGWRIPIASGQVQGTYGIQSAFPQLTFTQPVGIYSAGDGSDGLFVA